MQKTVKGQDPLHVLRKVKKSAFWRSLIMATHDHSNVNGRPADIGNDALEFFVGPF